MSSSATVIKNGNSVELEVEWFDMAGEADAPTSVRYQVFDELSGSAVSEIVPVSDPAATMTFTVPGSDMPGDTSTTRKLVIQVEGTFATAGDIHTEDVEVHVNRLYTFA